MFGFGLRGVHILRAERAQRHRQRQHLVRQARGGVEGPAQPAQDLLDRARDAHRDLLARAPALEFEHTRGPALLVDEMRRLIARGRALWQHEQPLPQPPAQLHARLMPEVGADLEQVLGLLGGAGEIHHHAGQFPPGVIGRQHVDRVVLIALDVTELGHVGVAVHG